MILDESTISDALHDATADLVTDADLPMRVRQGGGRRMRRRRIGEAAGVVAVAAAIIPAAIALAPGSSGPATVQIGGSPTAPPGVSAAPPPSGLYAAPPPAGAQCNGGHAGPAKPTSYPELLMLPADQPVKYAFTNAQTWACPFAHVALTLLKTAGATVAQGVEIDGPNAPSATQAGYEGKGVGFGGRTVKHTVNGQPATVFYIPQNRSANIFWTGTAGDQWQARVRGFSVPRLLAVLNQLQLDPQAGTATLPGATAAGWTVASSVPDESAGPAGIFYARWDADGVTVDLTVTQGPNRTDQDAVMANGGKLVQVQGRPAVLSVSTQAATLSWQPSDDAMVQLWITHGSAAEVEQIAATLQPIRATDPRIHRP